VIYGGKEAPTTIHLEEKELVKQLGTGHFMNSIVEIKLGSEILRTLPKDVSLHPVTDRPEHVDFLRMTKGGKIGVSVPVVFINEDASPGLKKGGVLNVVRHELELVCENDKIPGEIEIDVTGKEVGDSIHISELTLPEGSESAITDRDFTIATLVAPSALKKSEDEAAAGDEDAGEAADAESGDDAADSEEGGDE